MRTPLLPTSSPTTADGPPRPGPVLLLVSAPSDPPGPAATVRRVADAAGMAYESLTPTQVAGRAAPAAVTVLTPVALAELAPGAPTGASGGSAVPVVLRGTGDLLVLADDSDAPEVLHRALALGCGRVLPADDELGLLDRVRAARDAAERATAPRGRVVGVRSATGGAGASCLAAALAVGCTSSVVLVDADAGGAGLEPLLGDRWAGPGSAASGGWGTGAGTVAGSGAAEGVPGWARLVDLEGQVDPAVLLERLPGDRRLRLLGHGSGPRAAPPSPRLRLVVAAAARAGSVVVVDLPPDDADDPGPDLDDELLVVPCTVPGVVAAARRLAEVTDPAYGAAGVSHRSRPWLVARRARAGLHPEEVADALGLRLLADVRRDPRLDEHVALGLGVAPRRGSPWARTARRCLEGLEGLEGLDVPGGGW